MEASKHRQSASWEQFKLQAGLVRPELLWEETSTHAWVQLLDEKWESTVYIDGVVRGVNVDGFQIICDHHGYVSIFAKRPKASVTSVGRRCYTPYNPYGSKTIQTVIKAALSSKGVGVHPIREPRAPQSIEIRPVLLEDGQSVVDFCNRNKDQLNKTGIYHTANRNVEVDFWLSRLGRFTVGAFSNDSLVGFCGAMTGGSAAPHSHDVALYYLTDKQFEGRGIASALAQRTFLISSAVIPGVDTAVAQVKNDNPASQNVATRIGLLRDDSKSYSGKFSNGEVSHLQGFSRSLWEVEEISKSQVR